MQPIICDALTCHQTVQISLLEQTLVRERSALATLIFTLRVCLSVIRSVIRSVILSVRNFGAKYLVNEAR